MIIGIGCDIVTISRIEQAMDKPVIQKILTPREKELADKLQIGRAHV